MILVLFTSSYPYDSSYEQTFLETELKILEAKFDKVVLIPKSNAGKLLPISGGVELEEGYALYLQKPRYFRAAMMVVGSPFFYQDLRANLFILTKPSAIARLIGYVASARFTQEWVEAWLEKTGYKDKEVIFYTYWFDSAALGIALAREKYPRLKVISRAHGYDLYEDRYPTPYLPCRPYALGRVDGIFPDSAAGTTYLTNRYPAFRSKIQEAFLGVEGFDGVSPASQDGVFRIVSCAIIRPVKRIDLLLDGVAQAARLRPSQKFEWVHFGNDLLAGERESLQKRANDIFPANAKGFFPGYSTQQELLKYYCENPLDVFVNVSESEGTPVSIMEAISCGIPVVATAVGGNREIVTAQNGLLLGHNPSPDDIANAFFSLIDNPAEAELKRKGSRLMWRERYDARKNFDAFADLLKSIMSLQ